MRPGTLPLALMMIVCPPARAGAARADAQGLVTQGSLLVSRDREVVQVPLKHTRVRIRISGHLAEATVTQVFENPYPKKIEALYAFPLPAGAAVQAFSLKNGERIIRGRLLLRQQARQIYRRASQAGQVAALLTQERPNLFTQRVANLLPGQGVEVQMRYTSALSQEAGTCELVFPMVVGPRFVPRKKGRDGSVTLLSPPVLPPSVRSAHDIDLEVEIETGLPLQRITSPSHRLTVQRRGTSSVKVSLDAKDRIPNRDLVLRYSLAGAEPEMAVLAHRPGPEVEGTLMLVLQPPRPRALREVVPREIIFVLDTSSSMSGAPLARGKELIAALLHKLGPDDTFQIVRFDERVSSLGPRMIARWPHNLGLALTWLDRLRAGGGTYMTAGLGAALDLPHDPARLRLVVFVTDGYIGNEEEVLALLQRRRGASRLFALGVGTAVNRYLLGEMAALGRGTMQVVRPDEPVREVVERFDRHISRPVLTDLHVRFEGLRAQHLSPGRLPDLYAGQPLVLLARFSGGREGARVTLTGRQRGRPVTLTAPLSVPPPGTRHRAVALAWARSRITELERDLLGREDAGTRQQIIDLSLAHKVMTRYTAFLAVDEDSFTPGRAVKVHVPVDRPQGLMGEGVGGLGLIGHGGGGGGVGYGSIGLGSAAWAADIGDAHGVLRLQPVASSAPRVVAGAASVRGSLDKEIIRRVIRSHLNEVRFCYARELQSSPGLEGRVAVRFSVDESGEVGSAEVASSNLGNARVEACVMAAVRRWRFPKASGGGQVTITYPFVFRPGQGVPDHLPDLGPRGGAP